jgi:hypothetical protein
MMAIHKIMDYAPTSSAPWFSLGFQPMTVPSFFHFSKRILLDLQYQPSRHIPTQGIHMAPKHRQSNITDNAFPLPFSRIWPIK